MTNSRTFTLTEQHLTLIRAFHWAWQNCETGAPEVDPKRPFGNSYVPPDIAELLGLEWPDEFRNVAGQYGAPKWERVP